MWSAVRKVKINVVLPSRKTPVSIIQERRISKGSSRKMKENML
jgi:hypothetical protein